MCKLQAEEDRRKQQNRQIVVRPFFVAGGDASILLETIDEAFHKITGAINSPVKRTGAVFIGLMRDVSDPDAATIFSACGVRFVAIRRRNMLPNSWADEFDLRRYRKRIETVYSQLEAMGLQRLRTRTNHGFDLKTWASLLALAFTNILAI